MNPIDPDKESRLFFMCIGLLLCFVATSINLRYTNTNDAMEMVGFGLSVGGTTALILGTLYTLFKKD